MERSNGIFDMKTRYTCVGEVDLYSLNVAGASSLDVSQVGRTTKAMLNPSLLDYTF